MKEHEVTATQTCLNAHILVISPLQVFKLDTILPLVAVLLSSLTQE